MDSIKDLLPIGSVVKVKNKEKRLIIVGVFQAIIGSEEIYDYVGLPYPEGLLADNQDVFNHDDIEDVCFRGYEDVEREKMISELEKEIAKADEDDNEKIMCVLKAINDEKNANGFAKLNVKSLARRFDLDVDFVYGIIDYLQEKNYIAVKKHLNRNQFYITDDGLEAINSFYN